MVTRAACCAAERCAKSMPLGACCAHARNLAAQWGSPSAGERRARTTRANWSARHRDLPFHPMSM